MNDYSKIYNILPVIFKERLHPQSLFHYTSITGFLLMLKDIKEKKCYLFPGNMRYQNDANELIEGDASVEAVKLVAKDENIGTAIDNTLKELNNNIYIACFSNSRDLLEQWKYYGKECGISIEFDFSECEGFWDKSAKINNSETICNYTITRKTENLDETVSDGEFSFSCDTIYNSEVRTELTRNGIKLNPIDVIYDDDKKTAFLKEIIINKRETIMGQLGLSDSLMSVNDYIGCAISAFIPICKNHFFSHEEESRLLFYPMHGTEILYREKNSRILPYIKCTVVNKDSEKYPIKSITVGPGTNQNLVFNSVINILEGIENEKFITEEECNQILKEKEPYSNPQELICNTKHQELCCLRKSDVSKVIVYHSIGDILVYKSPIPFRD